MAFDWSTVNFSGLLEPIYAMLPSIIPVVMTFLGIGKCIGFMQRAIRGA